MQPTLSPGDVCLCITGKKYDMPELKSGMIILLTHENYDYLLTKRIIAMENDLIEIRDGVTWVNHQPLEESYTQISDIKNIDSSFFTVDSVRVGKDYLFVMGDNRNHSMDSRNAGFGLVHINNVVGRPLLILWSENHGKIFTIL